MVRRSTPMSETAESLFPVRVRVLVPPGGLGLRLNEMHEWLREHAPKEGHWRDPRLQAVHHATLPTDKAPSVRALTLLRLRLKLTAENVSRLIIYNDKAPLYQLLTRFKDLPVIANEHDASYKRMAWISVSNCYTQRPDPHRWRCQRG